MHSLKNLLDWGFRIVVGTYLIESALSKSWNSQPVNSPPLSWMHICGQGYLANQDYSRLGLICAEVFLLTLMRSNRFVTKSILFKALNLYHLYRIYILHGPIRSTATSCHRCVLTSRIGSNPKPRADILWFWNASQTKLHICRLRSGWYYRIIIASLRRLSPWCPSTWWNHLITGSICASGNTIFRSVSALSPGLTWVISSVSLPKCLVLNWVGCRCFQSCSCISWSCPFYIHYKLSGLFSAVSVFGMLGE